MKINNALKHVIKVTMAHTIFHSIMKANVLKIVEQISLYISEVMTQIKQNVQIRQLALHKNKLNQ